MAWDGPKSRHEDLDLSLSAAAPGRAAPPKVLSYASWASGPSSWKDECLAPKGICLPLLEGELPGGLASCLVHQYIFSV